MTTHLPLEASDGGSIGARVRESRLVEDVHGGQGDQSPHSEVIANSQTTQLRNVLQTRHLQGRKYFKFIICFKR